MKREAPRLRLGPSAHRRLTERPAPTVAGEPDFAGGRPEKQLNTIAVAPLGASGDIPGNDDARHAWVIAQKAAGARPPSGATQVAMPATGTPGIAANARSSGNSDATPRMHGRRQRSTVDTSPCVHYRLHPGDAEQEEGKLGLRWVSGTTAPATEASMS